MNCILIFIANPNTKGTHPMEKIQDTLHIQVEYYDGREEGDVGHPYYVATNAMIGLVTEGATFEELLENLQEAIAACLESEDTIAAYQLVPSPRVEIHLRMPETYAQIS
jgi:predicted RNase H-like HicB family nuclease